MTHFKTIETDVWTIALPYDWQQGERTSDGELYFESLDGTKALYISTWDVSSETETTETVLQFFLAVEEKANENMPNSRWSLMEKRLKKNSDAAMMLDWYDKDKQYRIVSKILVRLPVIVKSSFHDYECTDYEASKALLKPFVESLKIRQA